MTQFEGRVVLEISDGYLIRLLVTISSYLCFFFRVTSYSGLDIQTRN